ncbi:MAG TPA: peroxiredoxin family protein [Abditibacteriaceae bacterium]|jgi:peroxiredoxin
MFKLHIGDDAPDFILQDVKNRDWKLSDHVGKMTVLYFARGEYCPTTRGEFAYFNSFQHLFKKMNCEFVFLVNGGREEHLKFAEDLHLRIKILVDPTGEVAESYGVYGVNHNDKQRDDYKNYIAPSVYVIDSEGKVSVFWIASSPRGLPTPECILGILAYAEHNNWKY